MAAGGGYNAPNLADTSTSFGSESPSSNHDAERGGGGGISSQPLFGVDYKRLLRCWDGNSLIECLALLYTRHEDLKMMLDNSKDTPKLDAMKMIIGVCERLKSYEFIDEHLLYHSHVDGGEREGLFGSLPSCRQECGI